MNSSYSFGLERAFQLGNSFLCFWKIQSLLGESNGRYLPNGCWGDFVTSTQWLLAMTVVTACFCPLLELRLRIHADYTIAGSI